MMRRTIMKSQSNTTLGAIDQSYKNDYEHIIEMCGELSQDKIDLVISSMKKTYGELEWLTFNHVIKRKRIKEYLKENSIEFFNISPEYLEEMKEQGIPLETVLQLD